MSHTAMELIKAAQVARKEHRLADAHRDLLEAVTLCRQSGTRAHLVQALKALGQIERDLGRGDAARPLYEEAVSICRDEGDALLLAHTVRHLGDIHRDARRLADAEPCYHEALALYRSHQTNPLDLANVLRPLAILKESQGKDDEARTLWSEARDLYATAGVPIGVAECSARLRDKDDTRPKPT
jgi:tetratricopeptide (TPR) repeat protein